MKKIISIIVVLLLAINLFGQTPEKMSYQAIVRDAKNALVANAPVGMRFSIIQGSLNGTAVYVEIQTPTSNANGLVSLEIGEGTVVSGLFSKIDWTAGPYFMKTETDPSGGTAYAVTGTNQLLSVPYALYAKTSGSSLPGPQGPIGPIGPIGPQGPAGGSVHTVGESYGGGIIFYVYDGGQHGLIAAVVDQHAGIRWYGGTNTNTGARGNGIGAGLKNTAIIVANQAPVDGNTFAARVCNEYKVTVGNVIYGDWYLPSKYELQLLQQQKSAVGGIVPGHYWSSTEFDSNLALPAGGPVFGPSQGETGKDNLFPVRAIRAF
jgi:hypothetical protein